MSTIFNEQLKLYQGHYSHEFKKKKKNKKIQPINKQIFTLSFNIYIYFFIIQQLSYVNTL
jgi:hypothetical protein